MVEEMVNVRGVSIEEEDRLSAVKKLFKIGFVRALTGGKRLGISIGAACRARLHSCCNCDI